MIWKLHPKTAFVFLFCNLGDFEDILCGGCHPQLTCETNKGRLTYGY